MVGAKEEKLGLVRHTLAEMFQALEEQTAGQLQDMEALSDSINAWLMDKKQLEEVPEWPFSTNTLGKLLMSTLLPILAWGVQIVVEFMT